MKQVSAQDTLIHTLQERMSRQNLDACNDLVCHGCAHEVAVILFTDIRGYTTLSETVETRRLVGFLNEYLELVCDAIVAHGGLIDKFLGDGVLAVFRAADFGGSLPQTELTAFRAALKIQKKLSSMSHAAGLTRLSVGVGMNSGDVIIADLGPEWHRKTTVIGDVVNTAARLCAAADAGEIVTSAAMRPRLPGRGSTDRLTIKGKSEKIAVYRVSPGCMAMQPAADISKQTEETEATGLCCS